LKNCFAHTRHKISADPLLRLLSDTDALIFLHLNEASNSACAMLRTLNDTLLTKQPPKLLDQVRAAIRTMEEFLDHVDLNTTMIYSFAAQKFGLAIFKGLLHLTLHK